jgi:pyruvate/2-oxoglutarate dehydrogenase complex dihydrolipoamide dehydrogenase (E3) component
METAPLQGFHPIEGLFEVDLNNSENLLVAKREKYKVVVDKRSRLIVGVQIISSQASDWIPILLLLIKKGVTVGNLANCITSEGSKISGLCEAAKNCLKALKSA